ncbi:MAG: zonular occludens toxin domain-containing protein [Candidatus Pacearchaeota archaeon]
MVKKRKEKGGLYYLFKALWFVLKIPYYIGKGFYNLVKRDSSEGSVKKGKKRVSFRYAEFKVLKEISGSYDDFMSKVFNSESQIGIILGSRGSGKTAFGVRFLENVYAKKGERCYAMGFNEEEMPSWIEVVRDVSKVKNNSFVLIDEGGILFSSRRSMSEANKILSELILISRHKNLSILFISQNSSNLEVNILRQADFLALKKSSLLQKDLERKIIQKVYDESEEDFKKFRDDKGLTYIYSDSFKGFISNPLPSFWKESISKSFR